MMLCLIVILTDLKKKNFIKLIVMQQIMNSGSKFQRKAQYQELGLSAAEQVDCSTKIVLLKCLLHLHHICRVLVLNRYNLSIHSLHFQGEICSCVGMKHMKQWRCRSAVLQRVLTVVGGMIFFSILVLSFLIFH